MKFHPIFTIIAGIITTFFLSFIITISIFRLPLFIIIGTSLIGGVIATYFTKEKRIRYGIYTGIGLIIVSTVFISLVTNLMTYDELLPYFLGTIFNYLVPASLGGFLGKMADKKSRDEFKINNGFNPVNSIIIGSLATLTLLYWFNYINSLTILFGVVSFLIGGFITSLLVKDKKIQYGLYTGIIVVIITFTIQQYMETITGRIAQEEFYFKIIHMGLYLLATVIGSYFGKIVSKKNLIK